MTKWYPLCAKFSEKEKEAIEKFKKRYNIKTDSQLLHKAVKNTIGIDLVKLDFPEPVEVFMKFMHDYESTISSSKKREEFIKFAFNWIQPWFTEWRNKRLNDISHLHDSDVNAFRYHARRGAPKRKTGKRGKPIDKGYER